LGEDFVTGALLPVAKGVTFYFGRQISTLQSMTACGERKLLILWTK
jgi:hypothetical protein